jgi:PAS domain S-box-containing protein
LNIFKRRLQALIGAWRPRQPWLSGSGSGDATASAEALQFGLELATQGLVLVDGRGRIAALNSRAQTLLHSVLATLPGSDFWDAVPEHIAEEYRPAAEQGLQTAGSYSFVGHSVFEDQWVEYSLTQHARGLVINLSDVSDIHRALQRLHDSELSNQSLFDANPQAMWLFDAVSGRILAANKAAAALYGMSQSQLAAGFVDALFPEGEGAAWMGTLAEAGFQQEMRLCTQKKMNGQPVLVELACSSVQWRAHPAVLVSVADVGARHLADVHLRRLNAGLEQRLKQSSGELQRSQHELETFTYAMSNDLKAPLHAINGFARALAQRYSAALDEQGQHYLERIAASAGQLARLIDDLRTLTHLPRMIMAPEPLDLAPVCKRLIEELRKREPGRQLELEMEPTLPLVGDKNMLVIALTCLIDNAWKFSAPKEQGWIKVGLVPGKKANEVVLFVSDNGVGFDAAYADRLFTAFQRLHSSADFPGSGLGLAIVQRVAQRHGGQAWGTSAPSGGASFFLSLPQGLASGQWPAS